MHVMGCILLHDTRRAILCRCPVSRPSLWFHSPRIYHRARNQNQLTAHSFYLNFIFLPYFLSPRLLFKIVSWQENEWNRHLLQSPTHLYEQFRWGKLLIDLQILRGKVTVILALEFLYFWALSSLDVDITSCRTASTVASGPPGCNTRTLPVLSITNTPLIVPRGSFLNPIALIKVDAVSQSSGYGKLCFVLKVVLAFGESADKP